MVRTLGLGRWWYGRRRDYGYWPAIWPRSPQLTTTKTVIPRDLPLCTGHRVTSRLRSSRRTAQPRQQHERQGPTGQVTEDARRVGVQHRDSAERDETGDHGRPDRAPAEVLINRSGPPTVPASTVSDTARGHAHDDRERAAERGGRIDPAPRERQK